MENGRARPGEGAGLYDDPRAYDALHAQGTAAEVDGLERMYARFAAPRRAGRRGSGPVWMEPACGTGRYLRVAARRGVRVIGFDRSPAMVAYARRRVKGGRLFVADMAGFAEMVRPGSVDFAFNLINTIRHLESDAEMAAHLRAVARALRPGGVYVVGLSLAAYGLEQPEEDVWEGRSGGLSVRQVVQYLPAEGRSRWERVVSHLMVRRGRAESHRTSAYRLRCYDLKQWRRVLAGPGLALREVSWVDESGDEFEMRPPGYGIQVLRREA